jgi:predicted ATPase/class 3 adenylate cyclase
MASSGFAMRDLPSGTVTFLFTDIEGSTRLLSELGDAYADALAEHRHAVREACQRYGGVEVDTQGDAFFLAFSSAASAVRAARAAQEVLAVPVRMGIHTGEPQVTSEGYVGLDVHEGARICGVAHGGQIVLSRQTQNACGPGHEFRDLGLHRLKDLSEPVRLYQLGDRNFPPLRSLNATNLPALPNPLVGRERELEELTALLRDDARLVTVTGAGGTGKTRLALEVATELADDFSDGVFWAPLASLRKAELAVPTIEETIGAKTALAEHVDQKRMLLLLDNFEQLLPAATDLAALLVRCTNLKLLVTSRAALRVSGEQEFQVSPLPNGDAVTLFMQRARAVRADLQPEGTIAEICRRLDGLPLAVELAAPWVRILEPQVLLGHLEQRLPLLTGGPRDLPARQRTLRATIEWSYGLLSAAEQVALSRLAVFAKSWNAEAAESVCETELEQLNSLVEQNLVAFREGRFFLLETIREFGFDCLRERGEEEAFKLRHARYFVERAEQTAPGIGRPYVREHLAALEADSANLLAAMAWLVGASHAELALRLGGALRLFWQARGHAPVVQPLLEQALELDGSVAGTVRAKALTALAGIVSLRGDTGQSEALQSLAQRLFEEAGDSYGVALCLLGRAWIEMDRADFGVASELAQEGFELAEQLGDKGLQGLAHNHLGLIAARQGDISPATELLEGAAAHWREGGNDVGAAGALANLAYVRLMTDDLAGAEELAQRSLALNRAIPYELHVAMDLELLGLIAIRRHRREEAASRLCESLTISRDLFDTADAIDRLELLAVTFPPGHAAAAASSWGAAAAFRDRFEKSAATEVRELIDEAVGECRRELGDQRFQEAWSRGYSISIDAAIDLALSLSEQVIAAPVS